MQPCNNHCKKKLEKPTPIRMRILDFGRSLLCGPQLFEVIFVPFLEALRHRRPRSRGGLTECIVINSFSQKQYKSGRTRRLRGISGIATNRKKTLHFEASFGLLYCSIRNVVFSWFAAGGLPCTFLSSSLLRNDWLSWLECAGVIFPFQGQKGGHPSRLPPLSEIESNPFDQLPALSN
jgi:hypothetical protein